VSIPYIFIIQRFGKKRKNISFMRSTVVPIYDYPPPRISDKIVTNLGRIVEWYVEEHFSYIRVFGFLVPPYALPKF
jgi:hypothetical protein